MFIDKQFFSLKNNIILLGLLYVLFSSILIFHGSALMFAFTIDDYIDDPEYLASGMVNDSDALITIGSTLLFIGIIILVENMFLLCGVIMRRVNYIQFWVFLRIALLCIFLGTMTFAACIGLVSFDDHLPKIIMFYLFCVGFAIFEIATVNVYRKELSYEIAIENKICNIHIINV